MFSAFPPIFPPLPKSTLYGPPQKVIATRDGETVVVIWHESGWPEMTTAAIRSKQIYRNGYLIDVAVHTEGTSYTFTDEKGCEGELRVSLTLKNTAIPIR